MANISATFSAIYLKYSCGEIASLTDERSFDAVLFSLFGHRCAYQAADMAHDAVGDYVEDYNDRVTVLQT
jgi:hypothetical protein